jgi:hypothetical protein
MTESDGIAEVVEETIRLAGSAAASGRMAVARHREQQLHAARARDEHDARRLQAHADADRATALSELAVTGQRDWWQTATPDDVHHAWETAQRWREREPAAHRAAVTLRAEHLRRTDIDLEQATATDAGGRDQVREVTQASFPQSAAAAASRSPRHPSARPVRGVTAPSFEPERQR